MNPEANLSPSYSPLRLTPRVSAVLTLGRYLKAISEIFAPNAPEVIPPSPVVVPIGIAADPTPPTDHRDPTPPPPESTDCCEHPERST